MSRKSFSLIELMVVIAIVGVLTSVAIPTFRFYRTKAQIAHMIQLLSKIAHDGHKEYTAKGSFPSSMSYNGVSASNSFQLINSPPVYSFYWHGTSNYAVLAFNTTGLGGITGYSNPTTANPSGTTHSAIVFGIRDLNGIVKTACGHSGPEYVDVDIPFESLPSTCQCTGINDFVGGSNPAGC